MKVCLYYYNYKVKKKKNFNYFVYSHTFYQDHKTVSKIFYLKNKSLFQAQILRA